MCAGSPNKERPEPTRWTFLLRSHDEINKFRRSWRTHTILYSVYCLQCKRFSVFCFPFFFVKVDERAFVRRQYEVGCRHVDLSVWQKRLNKNQTLRRNRKINLFNNAPPAAAAAAGDESVLEPPTLTKWNASNRISSAFRTWLMLSGKCCFFEQMVPSIVVTVKDERERYASSDSR